LAGTLQGDFRPQSLPETLGFLCVLNKLKSFYFTFHVQHKLLNQWILYTYKSSLALFFSRLGLRVPTPLVLQRMIEPTGDSLGLEPGVFGTCLALQSPSLQADETAFRLLWQFTFRTILSEQGLTMASLSHPEGTEFPGHLVSMQCWLQSGTQSTNMSGVFSNRS